MSDSVFNKNLLQVSGLENVPEGWKAHRIVDCFEIGRGRVISQIEIDNHPGIYSVFSSQTYNNGEMGKIDTFDFDGEYLTWTTDGANAGTVFYRNGKFSCTNVCGTLKALKGTDPKFFLYHLSRISKKYVSYIGNPKLMNDVVANIAITRPTSLPEQRKIAHILSTVDAVIEKTEAAIVKYKAIKSGMMRNLFTRGIDISTGKLRASYKETPNLYKSSKLGWIPRDWKEGRFIDFADKNISHSFTGGPFGSDLQTKHYTTSGVRIIQLQNIGDGVFNDDYKIYTHEEKANDLLNCNIYPGEIIISKMADPIARACIIPNSAKRFIMASDGIRLSIDKELFNTRFVMETINHNRFRDIAKLKATGSTRARIGLTELKEITVVFPEKREQDAIGQRLDTIEATLKAGNNYLNKMQQIKQALMSDLLTGKVRVKYEEEKVEAV